MRDKEKLRLELKKQLQDFVKHQQLFSPIATSYDALMYAVASSHIVSGYAALPAEPDVIPILQRLRAMGKAIALPAMAEGSDAMVFRIWLEDTPLTRSLHGFRQPPETAPQITPDVILVPVVGFDRHYNRLGHGKGHFDRALARLPAAFKIGVAWSVQEVPDLPVDPWDVPLDAILTEREWRVRGARVN